MNGALLSAQTGLEAQNLRMQFISNNLANSETTGYKSTSPEFAALMTLRVREPSASEGAASGGLQVGTGVQTIGSVTDFSQGAPVETKRSLDIMINGDGFIPVVKEDGTRIFTRGGSFNIDADGRIVTLENYALDPEISVPDNAEAVMIAKDGVVEVKTADSDEMTEIGQLEIVKFLNQNGLRILEGGYYEKVVDASGDEMIGTADEDGYGSFMQGYKEASNVNTITELVNMINAQRGYEMSAKAMTAAGDMMSTLNNAV
ncbi:flagellar basal-body rod protein FlgG [Vibrio coralliirubri]|uniref:flagellar basal-body rod protein FlgG n=1 Tax=Vibrio coralliirubri TaxID=1516159 RepID=UPI002283FE65|nr:flagellar basal-body rod protein FlgG [Vibrio coralliirubri]MCY9860973.1 flagellar basal-body rod protein FlgG [Vibrio coralliirubri]